jgi:hypothetical protein
MGCRAACRPDTFPTLRLYGNEAIYAAMSVICCVLNRLATGFINDARLPSRAPVLKS